MPTRQFFFILLLLFLCTNSSAQNIIPAKPSPWEPLKIGGGGYLPNIDIQCDQGFRACNKAGTSTKVVRTDVYGAYWFNPESPKCGNENTTGCWQQIVTAESLPKAALNSNGVGGVYEIVISPSNTSHFYMMLEGVVYSSLNKGATWKALTGWRSIKTNANDKNRGMGNLIAVDPANENIVLVGTPASGLYYTMDGGVTFKQVPTIPPSLTPANGGYGNMLIAFDPTTTDGGSTLGIYVSSYGNGVFHTDAGPSGSWKQVPGTPTTHWRMICDTSGNLFLIDDISVGGGFLHEYSRGSWRTLGGNIIGPDAAAIAVQLADTNRISVMSASSPGDLYVTTTGPDGSWFKTTDHTRIANDIPWLAWTKETWMTSGQIVYDPSGSNELYFSEGIGVWRANPPNKPTSITWTSQTAAIEELDMNMVISPPGADPIASAQDRPVFRFSNPLQYPKTHGCANPQSISIINGFAIDWASSLPTTVVAMCTMVFGPFVDQSGISTNGGETFVAFGSTPGNLPTNRGGCIAAASPSHLVWVEANNAGVFVSSSGGDTWNAAVGLPTSGWPSTQQPITMCAADRAEPNTFYLYNYNANGKFADAIFSSKDGGGSWKRQCLRCATVSNLGHSVNGFFSVQLAAMPGAAGNLFFTPGHNVSIRHPANPMQGFYHSTNFGANWTAIPQVNDVWAFGFGKAKTNSNYATIYIWGWVNGVLGTWRSTDNATTWTQLDNGYPLGIVAALSSLTGDNNQYGVAYECFNGAGCVRGDFP